MSARVGDHVLVRGKVMATHGGYPVVTFYDGCTTAAVEHFDIVSVEQSFRIGDSVRMLNCQSDYNTGEIVALSPAGHDPVQAWIKVTGQFPLATRDLRSLTRLDN